MSKQSVTCGTEYVGHVGGSVAVDRYAEWMDPLANGLKDRLARVFDPIASFINVRVIRLTVRQKNQKAALGGGFHQRGTGMAQGGANAGEAVWLQCGDSTV